MKLTIIEIKHIIESTDKKYNKQSVLKYQAIPNGYCDVDGDLYYVYTMYDSGLLQQVVTDQYCKIIGNGECPF